MNSAVIFLEPKGPILEVIRAASERGFKTVAITSDSKLIDDAPTPYRSAGRLIDKVVEIESWNNFSDVRENFLAVSKDLKIAGIYYGLDVCAAIGAELRGEYNLPFCNLFSMNLVLNKLDLRKYLVEKNLSNIRFFSSQEISTWREWPQGLTAFFKPVTGAGSIFVKKCKTFADLQCCLELWKNKDNDLPTYIKQHIENTNDFYIEESFEGELMSVEGIVSDGRPSFIGLTSRILFSQDDTVEMGSCFPYLHSRKQEIFNYVEKVIHAINFDNSPFHIELIVNETGEMEIIDFNPRFIGADVLQSINHAYDANIEKVLLNFAVGEPIVLPTNTKRSCCLQYFLPPDISTFDHVDFPNDESIKFTSIFMRTGYKLTRIDRQIDYLGCYLTVMNSTEEAFRKSQTLRELIIINDNYKGVY